MATNTTEDGGDPTGQGRTYSAIVFGATGFTGKFVVKELFKQGCKDFAVAGRSEAGLREVLKTMAPSPDLAAKIGVIIANCNDAKSLEVMAGQGRVILDCVGPYRFYGEPVVKACLATRTHYLDITGEPQFMESMVLKYHQEALKKRVFIVSACAFDCVPADIGTLYASSFFRSDKQGDSTSNASPETQPLIPGDLCSGIESYLTIHTGPLGLAGHYATFESAVHGFGDAPALARVRKELNAERQKREREKEERSFPQAKKQVGPNLKRHAGAFYEPRLKSWCLPFPGADPSVVRRSQLYLSEEDKTEGGYCGEVPPTQYAAYFTLPSFYSLMLFFAFGFIFKILAGSSLGRKLLLRFPKLFTNGLFSHEGPSQRQLEETSFSMTLFTSGYNTLEEVKSSPAKPTKQLVVSVKGPEPGYVGTPAMFVQCYKTFVEEVLPAASKSSSIRARGGVLTPAVTFAGTTLASRLQKNGLDFAVAKS